MRDPVVLAGETLNHVTQHATGTDVLVRDDYDRDAIVDALHRTVSRFSLELHDYAVLTNHVHLVLRAPHGDLPRAMQYLWSCMALRFNRRHGRRGHLVQAPYVPTPVLSEEHYLSTRAYVAMNPVEAGLCRHPSEWRWCAYTAGGVVATPYDPAVRLLVEAQLELRRAQRRAA